MIRRPTYDELENRVRLLESEVAYQEHSTGGLCEACRCFESVTNGLVGPLIIINKNFVIEEVNERFLDRYALEREDVIGRTCYEVTRKFEEPCYEQNYPCPALTAMETGRPHGVEHVRDDEGIQTHIEEVFAFPLFGKDGEVAHLVEVRHDRQPGPWGAMDKKEQDRLEGVIEMAGAICLELNQPLQALSFHCERLQKAISRENLLYDQIAWIVQKIDQMSEILSKLQYIATYATKDHVEGTKIVDINRASRFAP